VTLGLNANNFKFNGYYKLLKNMRTGADKSLAFPICSTTERIFLGWVKEVRTTKSKVCGAQWGICRVNTIFQYCSLLFSL
jgi:hypothetical protein